MAPILSEFQRGQIVGARQAGASISETARLVGVSNSTVCRIMVKYLEEGKTAADKSACGRKKKLNSRERRYLKCTVTGDRRVSAVKVTATINATLKKPISTPTIRRELHTQNLYARAAIAKPLITKVNASNRLAWCNEHKSWSADNWRNVVWSDESSYTLFPTTGRVYVWRTPEESYKPECLKPTVKHGGGSVMVWGAISWHSAGPIIAIKGKINAKDYEDVLGDQVCNRQVVLVSTLKQFKLFI